MRKDALGTYAGNSGTPYLDNFSGDAVVFRNCIAPAPWSIPSHASFFTGMYPSEHRIHETLRSEMSCTDKGHETVRLRDFPRVLARARIRYDGLLSKQFRASGFGF